MKSDCCIYIFDDLGDCELYTSDTRVAVVYMTVLLQHLKEVEKQFLGGIS